MSGQIRSDKVYICMMFIVYLEKFSLHTAINQQAVKPPTNQDEPVPQNNKPATIGHLLQ